jgi:uncharacterized protein (DUF1778 family)
MTKQRIQVYAEPEIKRRIELAAARRDTPVTQYCLDAIIQQLADDDILEQSQVVIDVEPNSQDTLMDDLRNLHDRILARREGKLIDIDSIVEQVRSERDDELLSLR